MTIEARIERALRVHKAVRLVGIVLVPFLVWLACTMVGIVISGFFGWAAFLIVNAVCLNIYQSIASTIGDALVVQELHVGLQEEPLHDRLHFEIVDVPDQPIGRFKDTEFYEWLDVADEKRVVHRATFAGTVDLNGEVHLPPRCFILPPGLLYEFSQVDAP